MSDQPGEPDREVYGDQTVDPEDQLPREDTLDDRGVDDVLDEGYSPPDREPAHLRHGMTAAEQHAGETLDERLAEEEPEPDPYAEDPYGDADPGSPAPRAGRLLAPDEGLGEDVDAEEYARDVGIDGAGASAEEAAVHVIEDEEGQEPE